MNPRVPETEEVYPHQCRELRELFSRYYFLANTLSEETVASNYFSIYEALRTTEKDIATIINNAQDHSFIDLGIRRVEEDEFGKALNFNSFLDQRNLLAKYRTYIHQIMKERISILNLFDKSHETTGGINGHMR